MRRMNKKIISFGRFETASVIINALIVKVLLGLPQLLCKEVGNAAWIVALISGVIFLLLVYIIMRLYRRFPGQNILEITEAMGGKRLKTVVAVLIILPLLFKGAITLRLAADTINLITPYKLPTLLTAILVGATMVITAYRGIEGTVRMHALFVPVIITALFIVLIASAKTMDITNIFPFWGLGRGKVLTRSVTAVTMYTDLLYIFLLFPYVKSEKIYSRAVCIGTISAIFLQLIIVLGYALTTIYPQSSELFMPVYQVSRIIKIANNSQSIEAVFYPVWIISSLLYLSLSLTFAVEISGGLIKSRYEKLFILPFALIMFIVGYLPPSVTAAMRLSSSLTPYLAVLTMLIPFSILLYAALRKRRAENEA